MAKSAAVGEYPFNIGDWVGMRMFRDKPPILVLSLHLDTGCVRGLTLNDQGELGISLYVLEMLEYTTPGQPVMERINGALNAAGLTIRDGGLVI